MAEFGNHLPFFVAGALSLSFICLIGPAAVQFFIDTKKGNTP